ncbi:MAG: hypothetical protein M3Q10_12020 [Chloroflexota bacterium]|nr:hypothetical protein [Chloroflexota bacterium]
MEPQYDEETRTYFDPTTETYTGTADPKYTSPEYQPDAIELMANESRTIHSRLASAKARTAEAPKTPTSREAADAAASAPVPEKRAEWKPEVRPSDVTFEQQLRDKQSSDRHRLGPRQLQEKYGER